MGQGFDAVEAAAVGLEPNTAGRSAQTEAAGVVLRRRVQGRVLAEGKAPQGQQTLLFADADGPVRGWEHAVLVSNTDHPLDAIGQLHRDRADGGKGFDALKNQWGERCNLSARAAALIHKGWSWSVRLAHPKARWEAISCRLRGAAPSRPLLLSGVARLTQHAGQSRLLVTLTHAEGDQIKAMIARIRKGLDHIRATAPQLPKPERWRALIRYIVTQILASRPAQPPPPFALITPLFATQSG